MIAINILKLIGVAAAYLFLYALFPFWLKGYKLSENGALNRLICCYLVMHLVIIMVVVSLSLLGIYSRLSLWLGLVGLSILYLMVFRRKETFRTVGNFRRNGRLLIDGYYHPRLMLREGWRKWRMFMMSIRRRIKQPLALAVTLLIFAYGTYTRCYPAVMHLFFGTSDMYLHTEWIKMLMNNQPFFAGVYPFGFHATIAAIADVFFINVVTVMRTMGSISGMMSLFFLYYILRRTMHSSFAVNVALLLYVVSDLFPFWAMERQYLALPQEYGTIFLYLTGYFLYAYMKDKKTMDLVSFAAAVSMTLMTHFFITIFAVLLCGAIFVCCIAYMNRKTFFRIAIGVILALVVAVAPLAGGLIKGIPFNGSLDWALSFFVPGIELEGVEQSEEPEDESMSLASVPGYLYEEGYFTPSYAESPLNLTWLLPLLLSSLIAVLSPFYNSKKHGRSWVFPAFAGYSVLLMLLYILAALDIFAIMEYSRIYVYFIYSVPLVLAIPLELAHRVLSELGKKAQRAYLAIACVLSVAIGGWMVAGKRFMPLGRVWNAQYSGAVQAYYELTAEFPRNSWTMISSMSEYALCLFDGYHYEMADFMRQVDALDEEIPLTTENVFFYVIKRPNRYLDTDLQRLGAIEALPYYDPADASIDLTDNYGRGTLFTYRDYYTNRVMQAKAAAWAEEYRKYYPHEMTVYYEDDEVLVYWLKQNVYAPNKYIIPYIGNEYNRLERAE